VGRTLTAGYHPLGWDGRNSAGLQVSSGVYFVRAEAAGKRMDLRLAVVR
jgi:flagellar hook assembly protein FlgD